jgi:hypothetical protein
MTDSPWRLSDRFDPAACKQADKHYNRRKIGSPQFAPPGRCLVLLTSDRSALWVTSWPFAEYVRHAWPGAWVNSLFRREDSPHLASDLITWAVAHTRARWPAVPELGIVTFVDASKTKPKEVPGWCYRRAGWTHVGFTAGGLWAFQQLPDRKIGRRSKPMPLALPIPGSQPSLFDLEAS